MTFQKGHTAWNKDLKKVKKPELFKNNAPREEADFVSADLDLNDPSRSPIEYAPKPNKAEKEGFLSRLFGWFK